MSAALPSLLQSAEQRQYGCEGHDVRDLECGHVECDTCLSNLEEHGIISPCAECEGSKAILDIIILQPGQTRCFICHAPSRKYDRLFFCPESECKQLFHGHSCWIEHHEELDDGEEHKQIAFDTLLEDNKELYHLATKRLNKWRRREVLALKRMKRPLGRFSIHYAAWREGKITFPRLLGEVFVCTFMAALDLLYFPAAMAAGIIAGPFVCFASAMKNAKIYWDKGDTRNRITAVLSGCFCGIFGLMKGPIYGLIEVGSDIYDKGIDWIGEKVAKALPPIPSEHGKLIKLLHKNALARFSIKSLNDWDENKLNNRYRQLVEEALSSAD